MWLLVADKYLSHRPDDKFQISRNLIYPFHSPHLTAAAYYGSHLKSRRLPPNILLLQIFFIAPLAKNSAQPCCCNMIFHLEDVTLGNIFSWRLVN